MPQSMDCVSVQEKCSQLVLDTPNRNEILKEGPPEYSQVNILGRGSYGVVLKAVYGGRQVAVKIIKNSDGKENAISNEANILGWSHPNVVQLLKIESTSNYSIIIMERFPGQCLQLILDLIELPLEHRIHVALDVTNALIYCHSQQVLHLDVKPQNVLVAFTRRGRRRQTHGERDYICKLCDFGSSRNVQENARTRVYGTVRYMSPEALKGSVLSSAADVYSLGVTMWQLKARQLPYTWIECNQIVAYQVGKNHLRPNKVPSDFSSSKDRLAISGKHENCLCQHFSSEFSYRSLDQIRSILQKTKTLSPFQPKNTANHRRPEKLKNQVSRNLIGTFKETFVGLKENLLVDEVRCDIMEDECEGDYSLKSVFQKVNTFALPNAEKVFEKLFLSCWQRDAMARPSILDVRQTLLRCFPSEKYEYKAI